nr:MAG TPA: minor structural protein [Caudoviricetes sp.]
MHRDKLRELLGEAATDEVINAIMDANGKDINAAKSGKDDLKAQLAEAQSKVDELTKASEENLSDAEKWQKAIDDANKRADKALHDLSEQSAVAVFAAAGIGEDEYKAFMPSIVSNDRKATVAAAKAISDMVSAKVAAASEAAEKKNLGGMKPPAGGDPSDGTVATKKEFMALPYAKQVELRTQNPEILNQLS